MAREKTAGKSAGRVSKRITPEEMASTVNAYFDACAAEDVFPDRADMILFLGLTTDLYSRYETNEDGKYTAYAEVLKKARLRREGWLARAMFSDKNKAQSAIFHLRQPANGGYSDRQEAPSGLNIRLKIGDGDSALLE